MSEFVIRQSCQSVSTPEAMKTMSLAKRTSHTYRLLLPALALLLLLSYAPAYAAPPAQDGQYTVGDCRGIDQTQLRDEIERHVLATVTTGTAPLAIDSIVARKWAELDMDTAVDAAVQQATADLANQEGYLDKFISGWWGEKAQEYAERIANDAFSSPAFRAKLEELSAAIGADVARQVETQFAQAASVALLCLQEYVGEQYARVLFDAFQRNVQTDVAGGRSDHRDRAGHDGRRPAWAGHRRRGHDPGDAAHLPAGPEAEPEDRPAGGRQGRGPDSGQGGLILHPRGGLDHRHRHDRL